MYILNTRYKEEHKSSAYHHYFLILGMDPFEFISQNISVKKSPNEQVQYLLSSTSFFQNLLLNVIWVHKYFYSLRIFFSEITSLKSSSSLF